MRFHFLKTVWSDIIILEHAGEFAMIDTGEAAQFEQIREYLDRLGVKRLSFILLTHFHKDHYGCIPALLDAIPVGRVYFKEYSGLDKSTSWGAPADDAYRASEMRKWEDMRALIAGKSEVVPVEGMKSLMFGPYEIKLYRTGNTMRRIYEDASVPETYHQYAFGENTNSLACFMRVNGANVYLGGDSQDAPSEHPEADMVNRAIAREIGERIDLYKVPHHGTKFTGCEETLSILRPRIAVCTNGYEYLNSEKSDTLPSIRAAVPDVRIYLTEEHDVIAEIAQDGTVTVTPGAAEIFAK